MPAAVHAVAGADMHAKFDDAFADRLAITGVASLHLAQPHANACLSHLVAHRVEPIRERFAAILVSIIEEVLSGYYCSLKATNGMRCSCELISNKESERPMKVRQRSVAEGSPPRPSRCGTKILGRSVHPLDDNGLVTRFKDVKLHTANAVRE